MANTVVPEVHCALPSCRTLDFLPLTCPHCSSAFCRQHANPDAHACPQNPSLRTVERENLPRDGDHRDRIEVRDLLPDPKRHKSHDDGDAATSDPAKLELKAKQTAALAKLRASFGDKKKASGPMTNATTAGAAKPKPANPALELMRLKQRAVPADPKHVQRPGDVSIVDRLFLNVSFVDADGTRRGDEKPVWVSKVGFAAIQCSQNHRFPSKRMLR